MLKSFLITCLLALLAFTATNAQTLKVTAVDASETKLYDFAAKAFLGKTMVLTIYDNSVSVVLNGKDAIILKIISDNNYSTVEYDSDKESRTFYLTISKTVGVITSATLKYKITEKGGKYRTANWIITGKRF